MEENISDKEQGEKLLNEAGEPTHDHEKIAEDPTKIKVNLNVSENVSGLIAFLKSTVSFQKGVKKRETISNIKRDIVFQGHNVWILVCSMIIASVGLNMDSTAVVIGAMLISPLMSPILGVGLGVATVDVKLIYASLKNFGLMILISLIAAFIYFLITPVKVETSELLGRVKPNAFDIPIAFFGGLAGIIAASRGSKGPMNVVPGVAIATALMPPLCTTAYGLANGHLDYALGAFYLFLLNCLFICLATILTLRYLKFPTREFVDQKVEKKAKLYMYIFLGIIIVPAVWLSISTIKESWFETDVDEFITEVVKSNPDIEVDYKTHYEKEGYKVFVHVLNDEVIVTDAVIEQWKSQMHNYDLKSTWLKVSANDINAQIEKKLKDAKLFDNGSNEGYKIINQKESQIVKLEEQIKKIEASKDSLSVNDLNELELKKVVIKSFPKLTGLTIYSNDASVLLKFDPNSIDSVGKVILKSKIEGFIQGKGLPQNDIQLVE
jgi:uncharacterized hydrophobic protein (TIGR00271 family)